MNNKVARTQVENKLVSTIELPFGHGLDGEDWFETMVFPCDDMGEIVDFIDEQCHRYRTMEEAVKGHEKVVSNLKVNGG